MPCRLDIEKTSIGRETSALDIGARQFNVASVPPNTVAIPGRFESPHEGTDDLYSGVGEFALGEVEDEHVTIGRQEEFPLVGYGDEIVCAGPPGVSGPPLGIQVVGFVEFVGLRLLGVQETGVAVVRVSSDRVVSGDIVRPVGRQVGARCPEHLLRLVPDHAVDGTETRHVLEDRRIIR